MTTHPEHPDWMDVRFMAEALKEWGLAFPDVPPGDEMVLWMRMEPCSICGKKNEGELGAVDPEYVTADGLLVGKQICEACLEKGE